MATKSKNVKKSARQLSAEKKTSKKAEKSRVKKKEVFKTYTLKPKVKVSDKNVCATSPKKTHCFHSKQIYNGGYALNYNSYPETYCCFCNIKESELHGPYHPNKPTATSITTTIINNDPRITTYTEAGYGYTSPPTVVCNGGNTTGGCKCGKHKINGVCQG